MKNLVQRLVGGAVALGLTACVGTTEHPEIKRTYTTQIPGQCLDHVEVPATLDYGTIVNYGTKWDRAYFQVIDMSDDEERLVLFHLRFESDCGNQDKPRAIRVLSSAEVRGLGIQTQQQLSDYLKGKAEHTSGYLGPNLML